MSQWLKNNHKIVTNSQDCSCPFPLTGGMHDSILAYRDTTVLLSATRREAAYFHVIFQRPQQNKWVKIWRKWLCPSVRATVHSVGTRVEATRAQVNALKFRAPSVHSRHPWFIREVWWRWLLRRASQGPLGNWIHRGKILRKPEPSPTDLEGQCAYSITRCGVSAWLGRWGLARGFFWKVSDKLSPCPPPTPFPNPARSCFADRSARRGETRAPWWDYFTVYTRSSIGFLSRPRHIISITRPALKTKKGQFVRKNLESS